MSTEIRGFKPVGAGYYAQKITHNGVRSYSKLVKRDRSGPPNKLQRLEAFKKKQADAIAARRR